MAITYSKGDNQPGKIANVARGQLLTAEQGKRIIPCPHSHLRIWSCETGLAVPSRPASACSFPYPRLSLVLTYEIPPAFRGGVHTLSVHTMYNECSSTSMYIVEK